MQVDVRLLPPESFGAALQYFTGSKAHNVALRQRALKMGYTLNEYAWRGSKTNKPVAAQPKRRSTPRWARLDAARTARKSGRDRGRREHTLPAADRTRRHPRRRAHAHRRHRRPQHHPRDGRGRADRGYQYIAITDHSKNLAMANGLDEKRALEHIERIRAVEKTDGRRIRIFAGIEVDILADGALDLDDSPRRRWMSSSPAFTRVSTRTAKTMTDRLLSAIANPNTSLIGHPTGRLLLRRDAYPFRSRRGAQSRGRNTK